MKTNFALILSFLICFYAQAQSNAPENRIVVLGTSTVKAPADQIRFYVTLESIDSTNIDKVYQKHQAQEQKLVKLLQDLNLPSSDITYSLFSVNKGQNYVDRKRVSYYTGRQNVVFTINSLDNLYTIQARLINEGFSNFSSTFTSTQIKQRQAEALENAVSTAKEKAEVLARVAGRNIKRIVKVSDTEETDPVIKTSSAVSLYEIVDTGYGASNLMNFQQTIPVTASVKVVFELK
jgi:uncharacterized protein